MLNKVILWMAVTCSTSSPLLSSGAWIIRILNTLWLRLDSVFSAVFATFLRFCPEINKSVILAQFSSASELHKISSVWSQAMIVKWNNTVQNKGRLLLVTNNDKCLTIHSSSPKAHLSLSLVTLLAHFLWLVSSYLPTNFHLQHKLNIHSLFSVHVHNTTKYLWEGSPQSAVNTSIPYSTAFQGHMQDIFCLSVLWILLSLLNHHCRKDNFII